MGEVDNCNRIGLQSDMMKKMKVLKPANLEPRQVNAISPKAPPYFVKAELIL